MFGSILGNEPLKETLIRLRSADRIPNAMLFAGPDGVGKRLFALEVAKTFVCRSPKSGLSCGECAACSRVGQFEFPETDDRDGFRKVIFSNHPDVGMITAYNRNIFVDAVRDLETEAHFRPYEGEARTFIIDDADKMNDAASNALLKTLEEPPSTSRLILVTSRAETLLPTIRSRCQTFRFAPVPTHEIQEFLAHNGMNENESQLAARISQGSVGKATSIDIARLRNRRTELMGLLSDAFVRGDRVSLLRASENLAEAKNKEFFEEDLDLLLTLLRDTWSIALGGGEGTLLHIDIFHDLEKIAKNAEPKQLSGSMSAIELMRERFAVNINKKFATDNLFMTMAG